MQAFDNFIRLPLTTPPLVSQANEFPVANNIIEGIVQVQAVLFGRQVLSNCSAPETMTLMAYLPPAVARLLQPVSDRPSDNNKGHRLDVSTVPFIVKDIGAAKGQTNRGVVSVSPDLLQRPLEKQLYVITHELTHVLQFDVIGPPGADADTRWSLMSNRYAAETKEPGRGSQYEIPADLHLAGLSVVDPRFPLEPWRRWWESRGRGASSIDRRGE